MTTALAGSLAHAVPDRMLAGQALMTVAMLRTRAATSPRSGSGSDDFTLADAPDRTADGNRSDIADVRCSVISPRLRGTVACRFGR